MKISLLSFFLLLLLKSQITHAQNGDKAAVKDIVSSVTKFSNNNALEKVYLQTDKSFYAANDTLWLKAYLFNAAYLTASQKSGILYVEIANDQNIAVKRFMVSLYSGLGWGDIALNDKEFPAGSYCLRAYTNWMRNFDEHYIYKKQFYISSPGEKDLLFASRLNIKEEAGKQKAEVNLQVNKTNLMPLLLADFQLKINQGNKVWYRDKVQTRLNGSFDFNFEVPAKADPNKLSITLQPINTKKDEANPVYEIPIILNRSGNIDLQFMPEGGYLVAGLNSHIAFKALGENGNGANVSGVIYDSKQQQVISFGFSHLGMGSFDFLPLAGETYTAKIKFPNDSLSKSYPLPAIKSSGLVLNIVNKLEDDSLEVTLTATPDLQAANPVYYLIGQSRGIGCFGAIIRLSGNLCRIKISKSAFPTGIARLTLFNPDKQALNERIVYIGHNDHLCINLSANKPYYTKRDSVGLDLMVTDKAGHPIQGDFSVAVTDDEQVKNDSLEGSSLKSSMLLTSGLKGNVESPGYYFPATLTPAIWAQLDDLLLAQGWVNYNWAAVFELAKPISYLAEPAFSVKGKVAGIFNKPANKVHVTLLSKKPAFVIDTVTDKNGIFNFTNIYPADTAVYFLQAQNKNERTINVNINIDEFKPPLLSSPPGRITPWYVNNDSANTKMLTHYLTYKKESENITGGHILKEVKITGVKVVKGSKNLNGDGGSDFAMNEEDLKKANKTTLYDLLVKNVKGFKLGYGMMRNVYALNDKILHFVFDGVDLDHVSPPGINARMENVKQLLDYFTAEDIKGIEVMNTVRYDGAYVFRYLGRDASPFYHAFIEITTYRGVGPYFKKTPGQYIYKPMSFCLQQQFYSPKYLIKNDGSFIDTRSTIYWSPNIITDQNGKAKFSFYTADKPGTYTILIDGCDMNGNLESTWQKIVVK